MIALLVACVPDDYDPSYVPDDAEPVDAAIVGEWTSEGDDLSDLFAGEPFSYVRVDAVFAADGTYEVVVVAGDGTATLTGTYSVSTNTDPAAVTLSQTEPVAAFAEGIWRVEDVLTYEVVQTVPDYGYAPPTAVAGFGSSSGPNLAPGANVQVYR